MTTRTQYEHLKYHLGDNFKITEEEAVQNLVKHLISALYKPQMGVTSVIDEDRIEFFNLNKKEPVNWSSLYCSEVKKFEDGTFLVTLEEASPSDCPRLCEFIETYMESYGWITQVQTEW